MDSLAAALGGTTNADLDSLSLGADFPELGGTSMAECRSFSTREHGSHPALLSGEVWPADRIDTSGNRVQPPTGHAVLDRRRREAQLKQVASGQNPVLPFRKPPCPRALLIRSGL
jgi:hypothetical protein